MDYNEYLEKHKSQSFICHLPCKIGDTVYLKFGKAIHKCTAKDFHISDFTVDLDCLLDIEDDHSWILIPNVKISEFGKSLFLDKAEAERS